MGKPQRRGGEQPLPQPLLEVNPRRGDQRPGPGPAACIGPTAIPLAFLKKLGRQPLADLQLVFNPIV